MLWHQHLEIVWTGLVGGGVLDRHARGEISMHLCECPTLFLRSGVGVAVLGLPPTERRSTWSGVGVVSKDGNGDEWGRGLARVRVGTEVNRSFVGDKIRWQSGGN